MRRKCIILSILAVAFLTFSCGSHPSADGEAGRELARLDSLVEADADSALRLMGQMQSEEWSRRDAMRLELLRAKAMNRADSLFTTDSLMLRVAEYYRRHGSQNDRMLSLYLLGCTYRDMGAAPRAIETWQQAVAEADTTRQDCDLSTLMRIHSQMGRLFRMQHLPEYEKEELEQAEALCWRMRDTISAIAFEQASCNSLFNKKDYKGCIQRADTLYHKYMAMGLTEDAALVSVFCVRSYLELKDLNNVKHYLEIYESYALSEKDHRKINGGLAPYYIYKGNYYLGIGNIDSAEYCFRQAMPEMHMLHNDVDVYYRLYQIYAQKNQPDSTQKYVLLYASAKEKKFDALKSQATADAKNLYDYSVEQIKANEAQRKAARQAGYIYLLISILALCFCVALFTWGRMKRKELKLLKKNARISLLRIWLAEVRMKLKAAQEELTLLNCRATEQATEYLTLKKTLDEKTASEEKEKGRDGLKEIIHEKELAICQLENQIENLKQMMETMDTAKKIGNLKSLSIFEQLRLCLNRPNENPLYNSYWNKLKMEVESKFPTFYGITHANGALSDDEYKVCMLTIGDFSVKDINQLLGKKEYASITKKRLLKKIFKMEGKPADFNKQLFAILDI